MGNQYLRGMRAMIVVLLLAVLAGCISENKHRIIAGELTVYFLDKKDEKKSEWLANYWKENELMTGRKQDIQLSHDDRNRYVVSLVAKHPEDAKNMPVQERFILSRLRADIQNEGFPDDIVILAVCDANFEPITIID